MLGLGFRVFFGLWFRVLGLRFWILGRRLALITARLKGHDEHLWPAA